MDAEVAKATQKLLTKQGMKFKLNTKVTAGDAEGQGVKINVEAAKGGKEDVVSTLLRALVPRANLCSSTLMLSLLLSVAAHTPTV
jgi:pyruvate/2-oxoglutarate dehydrogenase complex dihydrolipoamide dehydrogenase (E3) component